MCAALSAISEYIWDEKYRLKDNDGKPIDKTIEDTFSRVARALASVEPEDQREKWAATFYDVLSNFEVLPGGRILAGAGSGRAVTLANCFVLDNVPDSLAGIHDVLKDGALTMQQGGGIGTDFSTLRPQGAKVNKLGSTASGPLSFMDNWDSMCRTIMSASHRRGAMMGTLRIDHPDVEAFIEAKRDGKRFRNFNLSVLITSAFMQAVRDDGDWELIFGDVVYKRLRARDLWHKIMRSTYDFADPGVIFIDRVNAANPLRSIETISCCNPCFVGETLVWTLEGPKPFSDLAKSGRTVQVLTMTAEGEVVFRDMTKPRMTRRNAKLVEVTFRGSTRYHKKETTVVCTPSHEFHLTDGRCVAAKDLQPDDSIVSAYLPPNAYPRRVSHTGGYTLLHHLTAEYKYRRWPDYPREHVHHKDGDNTNNSIDNIEILSARVHNSMHVSGDNNPMRRFPKRNHFRRDHENYINTSGARNGRYRFDIDDKALRALRVAGLSMAAIAQKTGCSSYTVAKRLGWKRHNHKVVSVKSIERRDDVYCGTVAETGRFFVITGEGEAVLVSNCAEQMLPPNGTCNLGSINLARLVHEPFVGNAGKERFAWTHLGYLVSVLVRMLDNVLDVTGYPLSVQREEALAKRRIGIGITGLADALAMMGVKYSSPLGVQFTKDVVATIKKHAELASADLGEEKGSFPLFKPEFYDGRFKCRRNSHLMSIQPTGTVSLFAGNVSSGIEPIFDLSLKRRIRQKDDSWKEVEIKDYAWEQWQEVQSKHTGTGDLGAEFETTAQLEPIHHLRHLAAAQENIDSSVSKTINCPESISFEDFQDIYQQAYTMGAKSCTTYRPNKITGSILSSDTMTTEKGSSDMGNVVELSKPLVRPEQLIGSTYRLKPTNLEHALFITINDVEVNNVRRPYEIFINTKNLEFISWTTALTVMISAIFRKGGDVSFIGSELGAVFDPRGGYWEGKEYVPSVIAGIGRIIEAHVAGLGGQPACKAPTKPCPTCHSELVQKEGCWSCTSCTYSACG